MRRLQLLKETPVPLLRVLALSLLLLPANLALAGPAEDAEALVRASYFEGMPHEAVAALPPEACPRLVALLADPEAAAAHANVIEALGILECPGAYDAITDYSARVGRGEVDRTTFRALRTRASAMGQLAARDDRALAWLAGRAGAPGEAARSAGWSFRQHRGARLAADERRRAMDGLALSGRPQAAAQLEALAGSDDPAVRAPAEASLDRLDAIRRGGPGAGR